ncbi:rod shape-determining protein MreD [candidate division KSB3 bacterium]|uniref:Rod shape-determining protein MreD n=1 Tax=candidate division KSB3 bacterium TaxID=2044937 RepID=A0A2G6KJ32_9BACT|nr:MAG: rod shape-determining protein MreD [candidate division KSB3 bacterium]
MYVAFTCIIFLVAFIVQTSMLGFLNYKPDLILVIVVYLGLVKGSDVGSLGGFCSGLVLDSYSGMHFGVNALSKTVLGFVSGIIGKRLYTQSLFAHMLCVVIATILNMGIIFSLQGGDSRWRALILYEILENVACCPLIVFLFRAGERRLRITTY